MHGYKRNNQIGRDNMYKTSSEILKDYKGLKAEIKDIDLQLQELDFNTLGPRAMSYDTDKISPTNAFNSETENMTIKREDKIKELKLKQGLAKILVERIDNARTVLTERENQLIELRYIQELDCKEVWDKLREEEKNYFVIHNKAIEKMDKILFK
jgi:DNA-directed RNA polymerase specialized sigma subunit